MAARKAPTDIYQQASSLKKKRDAMDLEIEALRSARGDLDSRLSRVNKAIVDGRLEPLDFSEAAKPEAKASK